MSGRSELPGRWSWLDTAYGEFLASLPESLVRQFDRATGAAHVVTCGPAQVGKTTLVLSLLGVHPAALVEVSELLRAGRAAGRSSTPVPVRYRWSGHDSWGLSTDTEPYRQSVTSTWRP